MRQTADDVFDMTGYHGLEKYGVAFVNNTHELSLRARKRYSPAADTA